jgi:hypothetical protein
MAKRKFKVLTLSYIGDRLRQPGEIVLLDDRSAGENLERVAEEAKAAEAVVEAAAETGEEA